MCRERSCLLCKNLTDVFLDSHGPYMFICGIESAHVELNLIDDGIEGKCPYFEDDGNEWPETEFIEYEDRMKDGDDE